jgi:hypothetical protein
VLHDARDRTFEENQIRGIAEFLGLEVQIVDVNAEDAAHQEISLILDRSTVALVVPEPALVKLSWARTVAALRGRKSGALPVLVYGITGKTSQSELKLWSGGTVRECELLNASFHPRTVAVATQSPITRQIGGANLPAVAAPNCKIKTNSVPAVRTILAARDDDGTDAPLLVRTLTKSGDLFFAPQATLFDGSWIANPARLPEAFSSVAPFMLFLSYAAGDYGWHLSGHYANVTIDDPWLVQPYGYLDYTALAVEMEKHNFHTTIAFIPWNFDRSKSDVIATFRSHPDRYSICIHGNNHAHREFNEYRTNPLADQVAAIRQGIARMEQFSARTRIPYDRFMVFPHGVAPEPTFAALRTYGFLGTANSLNVPLGEHFPRDPMFLLRPYTTNYAGLLSLYRYPAGGAIPRLAITVQAFLGNPLLFYDHSSLFTSGMGAFNSYADFVNQIQPDTKWASLGEIARHSYLMRRRMDGGIDVRMLSSEMKLENSADTAVSFYVQRNSSPGMTGTLTMDGALEDLDRSSAAPVVIPAHQMRMFRVIYDNNLHLASEPVKGRSPYVYILRMISDCRDIYMSRSSWGNAFIRGYYQGRWDSAELYLERYWWVIGVLVIVGVGGARYRRTTLHRLVKQDSGQ